MRNRYAYCFLAPSLLGTLIFVLIPFADVIRRSFFRAVGGTFVGISNYREVLANEAFRQAEEESSAAMAKLTGGIGGLGGGFPF